MALLLHCELRACTTWHLEGPPTNPWLYYTLSCAHASTRSVASLSRIITSGALGVHANNPSAALLVFCADSKACAVLSADSKAFAAFAQSPPCFCSIWLRSSSKQASSVGQFCERRMDGSCCLLQLLTLIASQGDIEPNWLW